MSKTSLPLLLITRPTEAAHRFAAQMQALRPELETLISPVIEIAFVAPQVLPEAETMLFTSAHGVRGYLAAGGQAGLAYCVGRATARVAQDAGFEVLDVAPDAATLWPRLARETRAVLHARGAHVAVDFATLPMIDSVVVYEQPLVALSGLALAALQGPRPVLAPLFSPRTARTFAAQAQGAEALWAIFISQKAKEAAQGLVTERSCVAQTPDTAGMVKACLRLIDSL